MPGPDPGAPFRTSLPNGGRPRQGSTASRSPHQRRGHPHLTRASAPDLLPSTPAPGAIVPHRSEPTGGTEGRVLDTSSPARMVRDRHRTTSDSAARGLPSRSLGPLAHHMHRRATKRHGRPSATLCSVRRASRSGGRRRDRRSTRASDRPRSLRTTGRHIRRAAVSSGGDRFEHVAGHRPLGLPVRGAGRGPGPACGHS